MKSFNCLCCGDCCSGNMDIKLNLYDLYKLSKHLKYSSTSELFSNKIVELKKGQNNVFIPTLIFKKDPYPFCPFLINDLQEDSTLKGFCSIHPFVKPLVCILAPYSKEYDSGSKIVNYSYIKPTMSCNGKLLLQDNILEHIADEIEFEHEYFQILERITTNKKSNYNEKIYFFSVCTDFRDIISNLND